MKTDKSKVSKTNIQSKPHNNFKKQESKPKEDPLSQRRLSSSKPVLSKDNKDKKPNPFISNSRRSNNIVPVSNLIKKEKENVKSLKRNSVSPIIREVNYSGLNSKISVPNTPNVKSQKKEESKIQIQSVVKETNEMISSQQIEEVKSQTSTGNKKRKFDEIVSESKQEIQTYEQIEKKLDECYNQCVNFDPSWNNLFENFFKSDLILDQDSYLPRSLNPNGSKLLLNPKIWILMVEKLKHSNSENILQKIIKIFNEAFNYVSENNLLKSFFLKIMRQCDQDAIRNILRGRSK